MAKKSYKILKTIIAIILLTVTMLGLVSIKNNSNAVNYNKTLAYSGTQLLGNSMLYNNYGYNYVPYRGLALQGSQVYAMAGSLYKNPTLYEEYTINALLSDPNLYCMNNGYNFKSGLYMCYDIGIISSEMAYVVAQQKEANRNQNYDLEANAIWYLSILNGEKIRNPHLPIFDITSVEQMLEYDYSSWEKYKEYNISSGAEMLNQILGEANVASNLKSEGNISINKVEDELYPNDEGKYGPFTITYPNYNGVLVGKSIEVLVNGEKLENTPASGKEFYLTEEDGIILGKKNVIKVVYAGSQYSGRYAKFTPHRYICVWRKCPQCGELFQFRTEGYCKTKGTGDEFYKEDEDSAIKEVLINGQHSETCTYPSYGPLGKVSSEDEDYYGDWYQNLIYIDINETPIEDPVSIEFLAGKLITLKGKVWLDAQKGKKPVESPNDQYDVGENLLENIEVILKKGGDNTPIKTTKTDANGEYIFEDVVSDGKTEYYIEFRYDGINYEAVEIDKDNNTKDTIDSDAEEVGRKEFNEKFQTITKGESNGGVELEYDILSGQEAILKTTNDENGVKEKFAMIAQTKPEAYKDNAENIDLGLVKRILDLSAITRIQSATVEINGEEKEYNYIEISQETQNGEEEKDIIEIVPEVEYSLYLYKSDYNYRIDDYTQLPILPDATRPTLGSDDHDNLLNEKKNGQLKVKLKYEIHLNNESATDAKINNIAYYYNKNILEVEEIKFRDFPLEEVDYTIENFDKLGKANIKVNKQLNDTKNQEVLIITFLTNIENIPKDEEGNIIEEGIGVNNWVEITSYSTTDGYIDINSAPDNIEENPDENDTDNSAILYIRNYPLERTISGYVFEDSKTETNPAGDGKYDENNENEKKVNNVIVQLIEVKDVTIGGTTKRLEYIWQETRSGSGKIRYILADGTTGIGTYDITAEEGVYRFEGFIPGNYIVRFIYGDGTYYDVSTDEGKANILKYNGQDYKSAIDPNYQDKEYNENKYVTNASMARDNEMRRIEEMANVAGVTNPQDLIFNINDSEIKTKLENTWMCAETSDIKINIDDNTNEPISKNINFGLVKRPEVSIELEKHITALSINAIGVQANISIDNIKNASSNKYVIANENIGGTIGELTSIVVTNKDESEGDNTNSIGMWTIQTTHEKAQDEDMYITYTYIIKSTGEQSYIGSALSAIDLVKEDGTENEENLTSIRNEINSNGYKRGKYLGTVYYDGDTINLNGTIPDTINIKIEDYINETLKVDENIDNKSEWDFIETTPKNKFLETSKENVNVIQSKSIPVSIDGYYSNTNNNLIIKQKIDASGGNTIYRSYVAQLVGAENICMTKSGITVNGLGNLNCVQSYQPNTKTTEVAPERDEFIAETVLVTVDTGGTVADSNKEQKLILVIAVVGGLAVVATGIVLIKKFVIK